MWLFLMVSWAGMQYVVMVFTDHAPFLCYLCSVCVMFSRLFIAALVTCWERADLLAIVCDV